MTDAQKTLESHLIQLSFWLKEAGVDLSLHYAYRCGYHAIDYTDSAGGYHTLVCNETPRVLAATVTFFVIEQIVSAQREQIRILKHDINERDVEIDILQEQVTMLRRGLLTE